MKTNSREVWTLNEPEHCDVVVKPTCSAPTCSCSSARRVALSSSESELSELEESPLLSLLAVLLLTAAAPAAASGTVSSASSSGMLAKRTSNTSCVRREATVTSQTSRYPRKEDETIWDSLAVFGPWRRPHDRVDCTCNSWRTLIARLKRRSVGPGTRDCPSFSVAQ